MDLHSRTPTSNRKMMVVVVALAVILVAAITGLATSGNEPIVPGDQAVSTTQDGNVPGLGTDRADLEGEDGAAPNSINPAAQ